MLTKAIIRDEKILCGKCLNVIAIAKKLPKSTVLEIKCKARKNGVNCNEINLIENN